MFRANFKDLTVQTKNNNWAKLQKTHNKTD